MHSNWTMSERIHYCEKCVCYFLFKYFFYYLVFFDFDQCILILQNIFITVNIIFEHFNASIFFSTNNFTNIIILNYPCSTINCYYEFRYTVNKNKKYHHFQRKVFLKKDILLKVYIFNFWIIKNISIEK